MIQNTTLTNNVTFYAETIQSGDLPLTKYVSKHLQVTKKVSSNNRTLQLRIKNKVFIWETGHLIQHSIDVHKLLFIACILLMSSQAYQEIVQRERTREENLQKWGPSIYNILYKNKFIDNQVCLPQKLTSFFRFLIQQINLKKCFETHQKLWHLIDNFWNNVACDQSLHLLITKSDWSIFDITFVDG